VARASTEKLDSPRQQLDAPAHGVSLDRLDRNSTGSTRLDRQGLDNGLDSGSTEPRQLDSSTARAQGDWGYFRYKKREFSIQDIIIYHHISWLYHCVSLCIIIMYLIYHVPRRHMIYRLYHLFFFVMLYHVISCRVFDDTWT
jgi:hypothetical protein